MNIRIITLWGTSYMDYLSKFFDILHIAKASGFTLIYGNNYFVDSGIGFGLKYSYKLYNNNNTLEDDLFIAARQLGLDNNYDLSRMSYSIGLRAGF
jgi:hypothetical protein